MGDQYTYEESFKGDSYFTETYKDKQYIYIQDSNGGTYSGNQVIFDLSQFFNAGKFVNSQEGFIVLPIILSLTTVGGNGIAAGGCDLAMCVKSGYWNFIQSIQVNYRNQDVVQLTPNINYYVNYRTHTNFGWNDIINNGSTIGYYPDSELSYTYSAAASAAGQGLLNNNFQPVQGAVLAAAINSYAGRTLYNYGAYQRLLTTNRVLGAGDGSATFRNTASLSNEFINYQAVSNVGGGAGNAATDYNAIYISAIIRLKDISEFFERMPMVRGFYGRLIINLNLGNMSITKVAGAAGNFSITANSNTFTNTCPFMLGVSGIQTKPTDATTTINVAASLARVTWATQTAYNIPNHPITQCRLYCPIIELQPEYALSYIEANRNKLVEYRN